MIEPEFRKSYFIKKGWGDGEEIIVNNGYFCGKILHFRKGGTISFHYHLCKLESFKIIGKILFTYLDLTTAERKTRICETGDIIDIPVGCPHKIEALEDSQIMEFSTPDNPLDSYRIEPGDSQAK